MKCQIMGNCCRATFYAPALISAAFIFVFRLVGKSLIKLLLCGAVINSTPNLKNKYINSEINK